MALLCQLSAVPFSEYLSMATNPTYDELAQRVKLLEDEIKSLRGAGTAGRGRSGFRQLIENPAGEGKILRSLIEKMGHPMGLYDARGVLLLMNNAAASLLNGTPDDFIGKSIDDIISENTGTYLQRIRDVFDSGLSKEYEEEVYLPSGKKWFSSVYQRISDMDGEPFGVQIISIDITDSKQTEEALRRTAHDLGERVKELNCLYGISHLVENPDVSTQEMFQGTIEFMRKGWQYPEITCVRMVVEDRQYRTENFEETAWKQESEILVYGKALGRIEVCYLEEKPEMDEGPFVQGERDLINAVAGRLGRILERVKAQEELTWELAVNASLSELYKPIISSSSIEDIAGIILEQAKKLTRSRYGFVSTIDPDTGNNVSHTLTEMMSGQCDVTPERKTIAFPRSEDGTYAALWGHALNTGEGFFTNTPQTHRASKGLPEGHIPIDRFLSVPVILDGDLGGQIALANKDDVYSDRDLKAIHRFAEFFALAIQRHKAEAALQKAHDELGLRVKERTAQLRRLSVRLLKAHEEERRLVALELHDGIGQTLSAVKFSVENAMQQLKEVINGQDLVYLNPVIPM
ncbi:MAG: GAF domain-containing protein, partial [Deltaproteobacteria bacterium]|nr:GAF domain-containing protein [Deltaproteobacteria bacterium]